MTDEFDLIRRAVGGERPAFEELVRLKRELVVRTAYQVVGDLDDALDIAQGVFLKVWQKLDRYDPRRRFDTWLYRVTANAAIDHLRAKGPHAALEALPDEPVDAAAAAAPSAEEALDLRRLQRTFLRLAAGLAPRQRAVFVLKEIEGLSTSEVAAATGVAESTVRNHLLQARRQLREALERERAAAGRTPAAGTSEDDEGSP